MENNLQFCPGNSLSSFLRTISYDLKWRQIEHLILAYFNDKEFPIAMHQITGGTSWVAYSIDSIITEAKELNASGICLVHNHPISADEKPSLKPSREDTSFQQQFLDACQTNHLSYLGSWISSKGQLTEILYHAWQEAIRTQYTYPENELLRINYALTQTFVNTVQSLTKPIIIVIDEYVMGEVRHEGDEYKMYIRAIVQKSYPLNDTSSGSYQLKLSILDRGERDIIEFISHEELIKTCDGLLDLHEESQRLSSSKVEFKRVALSISDKIICGFDQKGSEQFGFIVLNMQSLFVEIDKLQQLYLLFDKALKHLESLAKA